MDGTRVHFAVVGRSLSTSATIPLESSVLAGDRIRCLNSDARETFVRERAANLDVHGEVARILTELCLGMHSSPSYRSAHANVTHKSLGDHVP